MAGQLADIAKRIASNTIIVEEWLAKNNLQSPSFDASADEEFPPTTSNPEVDAARTAILEDTNTLNDLISGPGEVVRRVIWGSIDNSVQQCIYRFGFLQAVPLQGAIGYPELAAAVGLSERQTKAIVRQSAMNRIFQEVGDSVEHSASSALLAKNKAMNDWYGHCVEEMFPTGAKISDALGKYQHSTDAADSAFGLAFNTREPVYKWLEQHPERQARFFGAMEGVGKDFGHSLQHIVTGYPWKELGDSVTVVDVGGSAGFLSVALARGHENLTKLVVQDYKHTVEEGAARLPADLSGRISFVPHDFFQPQPTPHADIYLARHILHNWGDEKSAEIIRQLVPAMKPTSRILLVEVVVTPSHAAGETAVAERYMRNVDVTMLQMLNTQERSESEWRKVVELADPRLELTNIIKPMHSFDSIIELALRLN